MLIDLSIGRRAADAVIDIEFIFDRCFPEPNTGCWIWLGGYSNNLCPSMGFEGRVEKVARVSFQLATGRAPAPGMYVCHRCDFPPCVNPDHLWEGTPSDNVMDAIQKRRHVAPTRTSGHGLARLSADQVRAIVNDPRSSRAIAPIYGVHETTVQRVRAIAAAEPTP